MSREHNPIARLISQIQQKWIDEVAPNEHIQLVRWLIKPDQKRLYRGFLKLESTDQGSLPCIPVVLLTAYEDIEIHSKKLIKDWLENFENDKNIQQAITDKTIEFNWNTEIFKQEIEHTDSHYNLLLEMLQSFQQAMPNKELPLVLTLFPNAIQNEKEYQKWIDKLVSNGIPENVKIMLFDDVNKRNLDTIMKKYEEISKSLSVPLDLDGAINKLAAQGNPNDPEVQFRKCMIEMGNSVNKGNLKRLHNWGNKGLEITKKTGLKSSYATAHLIYAGYLFNFKEYELVDDLLLKGMAITKQGIVTGDKICEPILIQNYGLQASSKQMQKKNELAANLFCKQADAAIQYNLGVQSLSAWWLAYNLIKKKDKNKYQELLIKSYTYGTTLPHDTLKATCINFISADYYNFCTKHKDIEKCKEIDLFMTQVDDKDWKKNVEEKRKEMEKKKLTILNWF
ncbi:hypothetical protein [Aquimarina longa]|uniref:hypothetical protein n=1 Tax=Aquimarina longa TaxID=1080221 RepID=UPI00078299F3|nr:hypothetical protein [Aquimarina longa]